ncbi:hypothetical protein D3C80_1324170 [compost metagenome]
MCSCSVGLMLWKNSRAWEKWSANDGLRWRTLCASMRSGYDSKPPSLAAGAVSLGQPPSIELGS